MSSPMFSKGLANLANDCLYSAFWVGCEMSSPIFANGPEISGIT